MTENKKEKGQLWLLKGAREVPGWRSLEADARAEKIDVVIFDRGAGWALVLEQEPPTGYEGMEPTHPKNGLYVSENGYPIYIVDGKEVPNGQAVISAIGRKAEEMLKEMGDAEAVLQRLGYAY